MAKDDNNTKLVELMLSTSDNPFNPFEDFDNWYNFDQSHGYYTLEYLARVSEDTDDISDRERIYAINEAIEEAAAINLTGNRVVIEKPYSEEK